MILVPLDFKRVFVIGQSEDENLQEKVKAEIDEEKDILFIDSKDSYRNLTLKHIAAYEWATSDCTIASMASSQLKSKLFLYAAHKLLLLR